MLFNTILPGMAARYYGDNTHRLYKPGSKFGGDSLKKKNGADTLWQFMFLSLTIYVLH